MWSIRKSKVKGITYYKVMDEKGNFVRHLGTVEKMLKMAEFYEKFVGIRKLLKRFPKCDIKLMQAILEKKGEEQGGR